MPGLDYLLFEEATGYGIFKVLIQQDDIASRLKEVQEAANDLSKFSKMVELVSFAPFKGAAQALENANDISEGLVSPYLQSILELNLPKTSSKKIALGVSDKIWVLQSKKFSQMLMFYLMKLFKISLEVSESMVLNYSKIYKKVILKELN